MTCEHFFQTAQIEACLQPTRTLHGNISVGELRPVCGDCHLGLRRLETSHEKDTAFWSPPSGSELFSSEHCEVWRKFRQASTPIWETGHIASCLVCW